MKVKVPAYLETGKLFPVATLMSSFGGRDRGALWSLVYKAVATFMKVLSLQLHHQTKAPHPNGIFFSGQDSNI